MKCTLIVTLLTLMLYLCREIFSMRRFAFRGMPMPLEFTESTGSIQSTCPTTLLFGPTLFLQFRPFHTCLFLRCHHTSLELPTGSPYMFFFANTRVHDSTVIGSCLLFAAQSCQSLWHTFPGLILLGQKCST